MLSTQKESARNGTRVLMLLNEFYYKRAIARAILFRKTEKLVSAQPWYNGGYRANIVAYTLALLSFYCDKKAKSVDFMKLWELQSIPECIQQALEVTAKLVKTTISSTQRQEYRM